jgi:DNA-binding LytR/AlgR family response regulator
MIIAVCDDERQVANELADMIKEICTDINLDYRLFVYVSGKELISNINDVDMVFLDINMEELDGIKVGRLINLYNPRCKIIMATAEERRFKEAFEIGAKGFISKPFAKDEIKRAIKMESIDERNGKELEVYHNRVRIKINIKQIKYCISFNGYVRIYTDTGECRKDTRLKMLDSFLLPRGFYKISRKCIVNMRWIDRYIDGKIHIGDDILEVDKKRVADFYKVYSKYDYETIR